MVKSAKAKSRKTAAARPAKARPIAKKTSKKPAAKKADKTAAGKPPKKAAQGAPPAAEQQPPAVKVTLPTHKPVIAVAPGARISRGKITPAASSSAPAESVAAERKLTRKEIEEIKERLILKREKILQGIKRELSDYRERSANKASDEADKASDAYDEDLSFEIAATSDEELAQIEVALEKIANNSYGLCESCNKPISPSRLQALPYAITCVACRDDEERTRKRDEGMTPWGLVGDEGEEEAE